MSRSGMRRQKKATNRLSDMAIITIALWCFQIHSLNAFFTLQPRLLIEQRSELTTRRTTTGPPTYGSLKWDDDSSFFTSIRRSIKSRRRIVPVTAMSAFSHPRESSDQNQNQNHNGPMKHKFQPKKNHSYSRTRYNSSNHNNVHKRKNKNNFVNNVRSSHNDPLRAEQEREERAWLHKATQNILNTTSGTLVKGKWHEVVSMLKAWARRSKFDAEAPILVEQLLKRLLEEHKTGNVNAKPTTELYNIVLDSWACAAIFQTQQSKEGAALASQRAREILVSLQEVYEREADDELKPNSESFYLVFHAVCHTEGPFVARRVLAWMEYLDRVGKNPAAKPSKKQYVVLLDAYSKCADEKAGLLTERFIYHMKAMGIEDDAYYYNLAIKAWTKSKRGREAAEHADRILEEMEAPKDLVTYSSVIAAWAASGMRSHAVARAEELFRDIEDTPNLKPNTYVMNSVMSTWVKSRNPAAVERTAELLELMGTMESCRPDLFSYNTHLHSLAMHAKRPGYARRANDLIDNLQQRSESGETQLRPNKFSYNLVIDAWSKSDQYDAAWNAVRLLRKMIDGLGPQPDTYSFNQAFLALSKSSRPGAAQLAERLLQYMIEAHRLKLHKNARPDVVGCTTVIVTLSRSGEEDAAERAQAIMDQMKEAYANGEHFLKPTRPVYNALIDCWAKSGRGTYAARKAEALLEEMKEAASGEDDGALSPNIVTYNAVLNAWAKSGTRCCANKAEEYLECMWDLYENGQGGVAPNDKSFNTVINAISKSPNVFKGQKALRLLRRMDKLYQAGYKEARPNAVTYTSVLNSCAFTASLDERIKRKAFDTASFTLQELRACRYGSPNDVAYGTFMQACANLLSDDDEMLRDVIEEAFQQCCKDGQVGERVLFHLFNAAPEDLLMELFSEPLHSKAIRNIDAININDLPEEWRRNVFAQKSELAHRRSNKAGTKVSMQKRLAP